LSKSKWHLTSSTDGNSFTYNKKNQTTAIDGNSYTYTGPNETERVTVNSITDAYSGLGLSYETTSGSTTYYTRCSCGMLLNVRPATGGKYYYLFDGQDSVVGLTDSSGNEVNAYDPYGNLLNTGTKPLAHPFQTERSRRMAIEGSTIVNRPIEELFDCVASTRFIQQVISPSWLQKNSGVPATPLYQLTEGAMGVGTKFRQDVGSSRRPFEVIVEVVTYQRPTTFTFDLSRGLNVTSFKWVFQSVPEGTKVTVKAEARRQTRWGIVLRPILSFVAPRGRISEQRLRQYLEDRC
jgi:hypothetical protein